MKTNLLRCLTHAHGDLAWFTVMALVMIALLALSGCARQPAASPLRAVIGNAKADVAGARRDGKEIRRILSRSEGKTDLILKWLEANP